MDSVAEPHQIVRFGGSLAGNSSIRWQISASESNDYGSTPVRNHSGSEAACEKPALRGKMFNSEAAAGKMFNSEAAAGFSTGSVSKPQVAELSDVAMLWL